MNKRATTGSGRRMARLAAGAWLAAAGTYLAAEALAALAFRPSYSYAHNYISDLGVPACGIVFAGRAICSPLHALMNGTFILQGLLFAVAALAAATLVRTPARYAFIACALVNGIGITLVGLFPENVGSPYHGLGALLAIGFGNATAFVSAFALRELAPPRLHRILSLTLPCLAAVAFATLLRAGAHNTTPVVPDGILERVSVYTITAWELVTAACFLAWQGERPAR